MAMSCGRRSRHGGPLRAYELEEDAEPVCLERIHELLGRLWVGEPAVEAEDRIMFATAVAEVAGNIIQHAAANHGVRLRLSLCVYPDRVEARFSDSGPAAEVDLAAASLPADFAESGRGLALATAAAQLSYTREGAVNRWRVVRRRSS